MRLGSLSLWNWKVANSNSPFEPSHEIDLPLSIISHLNHYYLFRGTLFDSYAQRRARCFRWLPRERRLPILISKDVDFTKLTWWVVGNFQKNIWLSYPFLLLTPFTNRQTQKTERIKNGLPYIKHSTISNQFILHEFTEIQTKIQTIRPTTKNQPPSLILHANINIRPR